MRRNSQPDLTEGSANDVGGGVGGGQKSKRVAGIASLFQYTKPQNPMHIDNSINLQRCVVGRCVHAVVCW